MRKGAQSMYQPKGTFVEGSSLIKSSVQPRKKFIIKNKEKFKDMIYIKQVKVKVVIFKRLLINLKKNLLRKVQKINILADYKNKSNFQNIS